MSNEHLPIDHPWADYGWANQIATRLDQLSKHPAAQAVAARMSSAVIYVAAAMLAFVIAIDGYVLLRTM